MKNKKMTGTRLILLGLVVIALRWLVSTGVDYGFAVGTNEGVSVFAKTKYIMAFVGSELKIDIFFDPAGYILIIVGMLLHGSSFNTRRAIIVSAAGLICSVLEILTPFITDSLGKAAVAVTVFYLVQVLAVTSVMFSFASMCTAKIDNYLYMEVGKDLRFAAELYGTAMVVAKILYLFAQVYWYFANILYVLVSVTAVAAVCYYWVKGYGYIKKLKIFGE